MLAGQELSKIHVQRLGQLVQRHHGRIAPTALEPADILLREAGTLGDLLLRQSLLAAQPAEIASHQLPHVHEDGMPPGRN